MPIDASGTVTKIHGKRLPQRRAQADAVDKRERSEMNPTTRLVATEDAPPHIMRSASAPSWLPGRTASIWLASNSCDGPAHTRHVPI